MTLSQLIRAVPEVGFIPLSDAGNLDRTVSGVDISETPDIAKFIAPDTLLLTTAMLYGDDSPGLCELIRQLHRAGAAGIAIKLGRFLSHLDPSVLETADRLGFPVLQIPAATTLGIASHKLQSHLWGIETTQLYYALDIQKKISHMLFQNASLVQLLQYFSRLLKRNILYFDYFFDLHAAGTASDGVLRLDREAAAEIGGLLREIHRQKPIGSIDEFLLQTAGGEVQSIVSPIQAGSGYPDFLVILYGDRMPEPFSYFVTEQAGNVFSFLTHNSRLMREREWRAQEEYFSLLLERGGSADPALADLQPFSPAFSLLDSGSYQVAAAGYLPGRLPRELADKNHFALVVQWLEKNLAPLGEDGILIPIPSQNSVVLLLREARSKLQPLLQTMADRLLDHLPLSLRFGVGNQAHSLEGLSFGYVEASTALGRAMEDPELPAVQFYHSEGIGELLQFAPADHIRHFCSHILKDLAYPDSESVQSLRDTLEAYLNCQCDSTLTAKTLYVHRNTVKYRLQKIQNLLQHPLTDPEFSLQLRLAIFLSRDGGA